MVDENKTRLARVVTIKFTLCNTLSQNRKSRGVNCLQGWDTYTLGFCSNQTQHFCSTFSANPLEFIMVKNNFLPSHWQDRNPHRLLWLGMKIHSLAGKGAINTNIFGTVSSSSSFPTFTATGKTGRMSEFQFLRFCEVFWDNLFLCWSSADLGRWRDRAASWQKCPRHIFVPKNLVVPGSHEDCPGGK